MLDELIEVAAGRKKADLVLKNARYADVFCGDIKRGDIAICGDKIAGVGSYSGKTEIDCSNVYILPAYVDGHVHIESSKLSPEEFASLVVPRGTTTVIADPHEIVNVCGEAGLDYMLKASDNIPLEVKLNLPSCVPATPFETSGAELSHKDIQRLIGKDGIFGLGEFMNYPAVIAGENQAISKLNAAYSAGKVIDGHAPALSGNPLNAYICGGISTDHECASPKEAEEKVSKGMYVLLRHASSSHDLGVVTAMNDSNFRRFVLCTDDRHAADLTENGGIDCALRELVAMGTDPVRAVTLATLNAAECYGLKGRGAVAPTACADLVAVENLQNFKAVFVIKNGSKVAENGKLLKPLKKRIPEEVKNTVKLKGLCPDCFKIYLKSCRARAIVMQPKSLITECGQVQIHSKDNDVILPDGVLKLAVVERHGRNGNIGLGLLKGFGFKGGAIATSVAHDSHNIIIAGDDNNAMYLAAKKLEETGGGMAICESGGKLSFAALDIAGLMSSKSADEFIKESNGLYALAKKMGVSENADAFLSLSFLSLAVIPKLKLLDTGLFDVEKFKFCTLEC